MTSYKFEYVWTDGWNPTPHLRSKTKIIAMDDFDMDASKLPMWSFDGSSTNQAEGGSSDCLLKPVRVYKDPARKNAFLVIAEVLNPDGTPHETNSRAKLVGDMADQLWIGYEQEYVLMNDSGRPIGFPDGGFPEPQGPYYCAVGHHFVEGREIIEEHLDQCLEAGIGITGINAEVMLGQWEYQCFGKGAQRACDDLMMSRYLLFRTCESYNVVVNLHPKPIKGDWNGSGMHANFSWDYIRETGGKEYIEKVCSHFGKYHDEHIAVYGSDNDQRLTGAHETASVDKFSFGVSDRGASIRIPIYTVEHDWKGYIEDRRPASNADPYAIANRLLETLKEAHEVAMKNEVVA
jgi:glutamine synthetase